MSLTYSDLEKLCLAYALGHTFNEKVIKKNNIFIRLMAVAEQIAVQMNRLILMK